MPVRSAAGALWLEPHRAGIAAGMTSPPELSIVVPAYNEEGRLPRTLTRIREYFASRGIGSDELEILIVDDGSKDGTVQVAEEWARDGPSGRAFLTGAIQGKGVTSRTPL